MAAEPGKGGRPKRVQDAQPTVAITIHVPIETMRLLQDVALAHVIDEAAAGATGKPRARRAAKSHSVETVIAELLERHVAELEQHARTVRGPRKK